jgi:hypothetical protein
MPRHDAIPDLSLDVQSRLRRVLYLRLTVWSLSVLVALAIAIPSSLSLKYLWFSHKSGPWYAAGWAAGLGYTWVILGCVLVIPLLVIDSYRFNRVIARPGVRCCPNCGAASAEATLTKVWRLPGMPLTRMTVRVSSEADAELRPLIGQSNNQIPIGSGLEIQSPVPKEGPILLSDESGRFFLARLRWAARQT